MFEPFLELLACVLFLWQGLNAPRQDPLECENIPQEILGWLFRPTSVFFVGGES